MKFFKFGPGSFATICVAVGLLLPVLSFDFGVTEDEQLHHQHGESILDYFLGRDDRASRFPLDESGRLEFEYGAEMQDLTGALNIYGGVFDLLCAAVHRYASPFGKFETRHLINSLFGVLLCVYTGLLAADAGGWRAGTLALLLSAASPRIIAHSMNNPVDLPFAALYTFGVYYTVRFFRELPSPRKTTWIPLLVGIPLATGVRISGLVLIFYLAVFAAVWSMVRIRETGLDRRMGRGLGLTLLLGAASYLLVSVPWPLAHRDPLATPLLALAHLSRLETFNAYDLFEGAWINRWESPWYYVPKWLWIGTPTFVPLGLLSIPVLIVGGSRLARHDHPLRLGALSIVAFAAAFPLVFIVVRQSYVYNDARHVLFAYPPLIALIAVAFEGVLRLARRRILKATFVALLLASLLEPLAFMVRNHPNEGVYFSPTIGGVRGAWLRYETDFWGNSVRQAVEWIHANAVARPGTAVRVRSWYGDQTKAAYYVHKRPGFEHVTAPGNSPDWDYQIVTTVECKHAPQILRGWPLPGTVYEVKADGVPLAAVVMNFIGKRPAEILDPMRAWARREPTRATYLTLARTLEHYDEVTESIAALREAASLPPGPVTRPPEDYLHLSARYFERERFAESLLAARLALASEPESAAAHDHVCAASIRLARWDEARRACERAVELQPDLARAWNNLTIAIREQQGSD